MRFSEMESIFSASDPEWDDLSIYYIVSGQVEIYISQG
jgi:CRP-like cAMP-binding protein